MGRVLHAETLLMFYCHGLLAHTLGSTLVHFVATKPGNKHNFNYGIVHVFMFILARALWHNRRLIKHQQCSLRIHPHATGEQIYCAILFTTLQLANILYASFSYLWNFTNNF